MNTLAIHHSKAFKAFDELKRAGIEATVGAASGDAVIFSIAPADMLQASTILQHVQADVMIRRGMDPVRIILLIAGGVGVAVSMVPALQAATVGIALVVQMGIIVGLPMLLFMIIAAGEARAMRSVAIHQLPRQPWESSAAHSGRVRMGKWLSPLPILGFIVILIFTVGAVMVVEFAMGVM